MSLSTLLWATAHEIKPRHEGDFPGGFVENLADLAAALGSRTLLKPLRDATPVKFKFETSDRTHAVRESLMTFAFADEDARLAAAVDMCRRLSDRMDGRNKDCLLLISAHETDRPDAREIIVWMFPADRVIQRTGARVALQDAFSLTSGLRKAALFKGANSRTGFLSGVALDHQSSNADRRLAEFWVDGFLGAVMQVQTREGTALLASGFRGAHEILSSDPRSQEVLAAAIGHLRVRTDKPWSLREVATSVLPDGPARNAFVKAVGSGSETLADFRISIEQFDRLVKYKVFRLQNGVTVSAPFVEVGGDVTVELSEEGATLHARGVIEGATLRGRA